LVIIRDSNGSGFDYGIEEEIEMNKKLIDLFVEYSKDKKQPGKVMFNGNKYTYDGWSCLSQIIEAYGKNIVGYLNDEIEILDDEDMEIEELDNRYYDEVNKCYGRKKELGESVLVSKINELVKEINKLKKDK